MYGTTEPKNRTGGGLPMSTRQLIRNITRDAEMTIEDTFGTPSHRAPSTRRRLRLRSEDGLRAAG